MDCDALLDHEINVVDQDQLRSKRKKRRKGRREEEERRGEKEGRRKRGNGKYYFPALSFSCGHVHAHACMMKALSQNIKCSSYCVLPTK